MCAKRHDKAYNRKDATRAEIQKADDEAVACFKTAPRIFLSDRAASKVMTAVFAGKRKLEDMGLLDPAKLTDSKDYQAWEKKNYGIKAATKKLIKKRLLKFIKDQIKKKGMSWLKSNPEMAAAYYGGKAVYEGVKKVKKVVDKGKDIKDEMKQIKLAGEFVGRKQKPLGTKPPKRTAGESEEWYLRQVEEGKSKNERYKITGRYRDVANLEDNARTQMYLPTHKIGHYGNGIKR